MNTSVCSFELISDLHIRYVNDFDFNLCSPRANTLVMAGDVNEYFMIDYTVAFFEKICLLWKNVIYVLGNHEFYGTTIEDGVRLYKDKLSHIENLHILDDESIEIEGVTYYGSTLWSNTSLNPVSSFQIMKVIQDYYLIRCKHGTMTPTESSMIHVKALESLKKEIEKNHKNWVIVTHHAPSYQSVSPQFKGSFLNCAFVTELDELVMKCGARIWCHGHVHSIWDYKIGETRIVCHPRGYTGELGNLYNPKLITFSNNS